MKNEPTPIVQCMVRMMIEGERYALEHPEDPNSADFLYALHEFRRAYEDLR